MVTSPELVGVLSAVEKRRSLYNYCFRALCKTNIISGECGYLAIINVYVSGYCNIGNILIPNFDNGGSHPPDDNAPVQPLS